MQKRFRPVALRRRGGRARCGPGSGASPARRSPSAKTTPLDKIDHIVVIYEENHSFDNLYGGWEGVNGRANADRRQDDPGRPGRAPRTPA